MTNEYATFLDRKAQLGHDSGFAPVWMPDFLFDFQRVLVEWALRRGRAAIFADCGLGKTPMQLVWAENVVRHTNGRVLILTPLAVAQQTIREGEKFGVQVMRSRGGVGPTGIYVTNYEQLHHCRSTDFAAVVCDESSILKCFDGVTRDAITEFMRTVPFRLLCTATAAPNDYVELGTSSEALGYLGHIDMLNRFFRNQNGTVDLRSHWRDHLAPRMFEQKQWRFKGHAEQPFWRWVCSWSRSLRMPSDIGCDNNGFMLPPLIEREHMVTARQKKAGMLFSLPAVGLAEQREERRRTLKERCEQAAALVVESGPAVMWCHLNDEGRLLAQLVPDAVEVSGLDDDEEKESKFVAFGAGDIRVLITKPVIGAWGLNWQHCAHMTFFASHSFEQYYQGVRRCWRFGQQRPVTVDNIISEGEAGVLRNLQRKARQADRMFSSLVRHMADELHFSRSTAATIEEGAPSWLCSIRS